MKKILAMAIVLIFSLTLGLHSLAALAEKQGDKTAAKQNVAKQKDPVCGMEVDPADSKESSVYKGKTYRFCSSHCKADFDKNPAKYAK